MDRYIATEIDRKFDEWMDVWIDGLMEGWMVGWMDRQMDRHIYICIDRQINRQAHAGTLGNEVADMLPKEAAWSENMRYVFDRIPKSALQYKAEEEAKKEWQTGWSTSHKGAATRKYFRTVRDRLRLKLKLTPKMTAVLTEHGMHRFHLR